MLLKASRLLVLRVLRNNSSTEKDQSGNAGRPTMCRSCGSIVGAGQQECAVCGASISSSHSAQKPRVMADGETMRFARAVLDRPYKFTIVLLVANVFLFLLMLQTSDTPLSFFQPLPNAVLLRYGAKLNYYIREHHQWWRFVTPIFLHVNLLHLVVNMYSLWMVGPYVEKIYGSAKFVFFWILTGIAGVFASYLTVRPNLSGGSLSRFIFKASDDPSAGASGALFGLVGVLFVFGIKFRHELPEGFKRAFGTGLLPMILMNLFIGYSLRGFIDNAAHLGGLVSGAALALVIDYQRPGEKSRSKVTWQALQIAALVLVAFSFLKVVQSFKDPWPVELVGEEVQQTNEPLNAAFVYYAKSISEAQEAFVAASRGNNPGNIDAVLKNLESTPSLDQKSDDLKNRLHQLLVKWTQLTAAASPSPDDSRGAQMNALTVEFIEWLKEYNQWLKTDAKQYSGLDEIDTSEK